MKVLINNVVNGKQYIGEFKTKKLAKEWIDSQLAKGMKCPWGKPDHFEIKDENSHENPRAVFVEEISESTFIDEYKLDKKGNPVIPLKLLKTTEKITIRYKFLIPVEYEITEEDNSAEIELREVIEKRKKEYPSFEEVIEILMDHGADSLEMQELRSKRQLIKEKYPKPSR